MGVEGAALADEGSIPVMVLMCRGPAWHCGAAVACGLWPRGQQGMPRVRGGLREAGARCAVARHGMAEPRERGPRGLGRGPSGDPSSPSTRSVSRHRHPRL